MEFNPNNPVVKRCIQGMDKEGEGKTEEAGGIFLQAWHEATNDFERFLAAHFVARHQKNVSAKLKWHKTALQHAVEVNNNTVKSAFPSLYTNIARCYEEIGNDEAAKQNFNLANSFSDQVIDDGPFYHGTRADLRVGDQLTAGSRSNYSEDLIMNHIYFTALVSGAALAAALAKGEGRERIYIVEPTGVFENDPNVTDKKFPGNLTRSYRTTTPLKIVGEVNGWVRQTGEDIQKWRERLAKVGGNIIN